MRCKARGGYVLLDCAGGMSPSGQSNGEPELLETWIVMAFCDQGTLEHAVRQGRFNRNQARPTLTLTLASY